MSSNWECRQRFSSDEQRIPANKEKKTQIAKSVSDPALGINWKLSYLRLGFCAFPLMIQTIWPLIKVKRSFSYPNITKLFQLMIRIESFSLTNGCSFRQAFLSSPNRATAIPLIVNHSYSYCIKQVYAKSLHWIFQIVFYSVLTRILFSQQFVFRSFRLSTIRRKFRLSEIKREDSNK